MVANNSLVSLSVVASRVNGTSQSQPPLVCQGIAGGQWYESKEAIFPLATPDPVTTPGGLGQLNVSAGEELHIETPDDFKYGILCCTNTTITLCAGIYSDLTYAASHNLSTMNPANYSLSVAATCK